MSKDVTRSIRLDGDVKEIAQKLADDKKLSSTLSKLLRQHYGLHNEIDSIKQQLDRTVNERMLLQEEERILADKIDELENVKAIRQEQDKPHIQRKLSNLYALYDKTMKEYSRAIDSNLKKIKARQLETQSQLIDELQKELEDLM
jgi:regulator of replication initiation timing